MFQNFKLSYRQVSMFSNLIKGNAKATLYLDFARCNIKHRQQIEFPISFNDACRSNPKLMHLINKRAQEIDSINNCIPGQFTKDQHLKAAYYTEYFREYVDLYEWQEMIKQQTWHTTNWYQQKLKSAKESESWHDSIYNDAYNEFKITSNTYGLTGLLDGENWFRFTDFLGTGPYPANPWISLLTATITKELINNNINTGQVRMLDIGCGIGQFGQELSAFYHPHNLENPDICVNIDGIDRSEANLKKLRDNFEAQMTDRLYYTSSLNMNLCDADQMREFTTDKHGMYDIVVSSDCLRMAYGNDFAPGAKCVIDLMGLVKLHGYFLIVTALKVDSTYNIVSLYDDILWNEWINHGFECVVDLVVKGMGDLELNEHQLFKDGFEDEYQQKSIENHVYFVKLMKKRT